MSVIRKLNSAPRIIYVRYNDLEIDEPHRIIDAKVEYNEKYDFNRIKLQIKLTETLFGYLFLPNHYLEILDVENNEISELVNMFIIYKGLEIFGTNKVHNFEFRAVKK